MGPLGDIAEFVAPYIADIVGSKLKEVMQTQVTIFKAPLQRIMKLWIAVNLTSK